MYLEDLSREELIALIKKYEAKKKYGLVWEYEKTREDFESKSTRYLPLLSEEKKQRIKSEGNTNSNYLIEGDNYFVLNILKFSHYESIDFIYIDPPYNTGKKDFKYNDRFVEREDAFRHSKWLSFMEKRLKVAKDLLAPHGIIAISIDDNEQAHLRLLCDEIFSELNFIACLPTVMNLKGNQDEFGFAGTHEYTLVYAKNKDKSNFNNLPIESEDLAEDWQEDEKGWWKKGAGLKMTGINAPRSKQPNLFFPIWIKPDGKDFSLDERKSWDKLVPETDGKEMSWRWSKEKFNRDKDDVIITGSSPSWTLYKKQRPELGDLPSKKPKSIWYRPEYSTTNGASQIKNLFGEKVFDYPKPVDLIMDLITVMTSRNALVLDFFAGSGTTGHALLQLNRKDGGNRRFILVTNNEDNICQKITYPRLKKVMEGFKNSKGEKVVALGGNLFCFRTKFLRKSLSNDELKIRVTENCVDLLCFKEGIFDEVSSNESFSIFKNFNCVLGIYHTYDNSDLEELKNQLNSFKDMQKKAYIFTFDKSGLNPNDFLDWKGISLEPIPQKIIEVLGGLYA